MAKFMRFTAWQMGTDNTGKPFQRSFNWAVDPVIIISVADNPEHPGHSFLTLATTPTDVVMVSGAMDDVLENVEKAQGAT